MATMDIVIKAIDKASGVMQNISNEGSKSASFLEKNWGKISLAMAGAGVALEKLARDQAPLTEQTKRMASSIDMAEKEFRDLVVATSNVTFPLNDVLDLMETGRQQGIKSAQGLQEYAAFWDTVGDATGESATQLGEAGVALRTMGIAAGEEGQALSAFGFLTEETTTGVGEFLKIIERVGPDLAEMGLSIDDTAALLGVLERDFGLSGSAARRELMQAVNEADGSLENMLGTLGISQEQFSEYSNKVQESSGVIQRNSDLHGESYTIMQKAQHAISELTYKYGDHIQTASNLVPLLMTIGPLIKGLTAAKGLMTIATSAQAAATTALGAAMAFVTSPIFLVVAAITAAIAIGWLLYKNWDEVVAFVTDIWGKFSDWFVKMWQGAGDMFKKIGSGISDFFTGMFDKMLGVATKFKDGFLGVFDLIASGIKGPINAVIGGINAMINGLNRIQVSIPSWVPGFGGKSFGINIPNIPKLHTGGIFRAPTRGGEGLALLRDGEQVKAGSVQSMGMGGMVIRFEKGAFDGAFIMDDYGVDRLMDRIIDRLQSLGVR